MNISCKQYDAIVVGVGGMGSAAVYRLAERGLDVLGIEHFDVPHARGSSHGSTRIVRLTQPEDPSYVPLARATFENWRELEAETGRDLLTTIGSIHASPANADLFADARRSVETHDIDHGVLTGREVNERFPGYDLPSDYRAVYQPDGGFVDCFAEMGLDVETELAVTGARARAGDGEFVAAVLGRLDALINGEHPLADPETGAVHACGHHAQLAHLAAVGYAFTETEILCRVESQEGVVIVVTHRVVRCSRRRTSGRSRGTLDTKTALARRE